jgi:hypothetical protein
MEMKTTAAELVVPFFKDAPVRRPMAAQGEFTPLGMV